MKAAICMSALLAAIAAPAAAQTNPLTQAARDTMTLVRTNVVKSAEQMPEEHYSFKPTPEVRSFGELLGHIANANYMICSIATGAENPNKVNIEKTVTAKADLRKAVDDSFAFCDAQFAAMTDQKGLEMVQMFGRQQPRLNVLHFNNAHDMEHYGNIVTYMRLKGLVPPSSQR